MSSNPHAVLYQASPRALGRATLAALAAGTAILVLVVLPAEYAIDPTGVGKALGLTRMASVDEDAIEAADVSSTPQPAAPAAFEVPPQSQASIEKKAGYRDDSVTVTLAPHSGTEVKARMQAGDGFNFRWQASAPIRFEMHGEPYQAKADEFTTYWKQKNTATAQGQFTAPFAGTHGWYFRNGGEIPVTVTVKLGGFYESASELK